MSTKREIGILITKLGILLDGKGAEKSRFTARRGVRSEIFDQECLDEVVKMLIEIKFKEGSWLGIPEEGGKYDLFLGNNSCITVVEQIYGQSARELGSTRAWCAVVQEQGKIFFVF